MNNEDRSSRANVDTAEEGLCLKINSTRQDRGKQATTERGTLQQLHASRFKTRTR